MRWITRLIALINAPLADRSRLALENAALRHQLAVLKRSVKRAKIDDSDRVFWILMRRLLESWRDTLLLRTSPARVATRLAHLSVPAALPPSHELRLHREF